MSLRIGSLFTGTGALDLAVTDVYDAEVVWHSQYEPPDKNGKEDTNQYAARILARHWPETPNLGDITKVDWQAVIKEHGPIDILTGGFPCQDVSSAGRRAGLTTDSRSGLWAHMAHAIHELNPRLVIIENVEGLLSAPAASDMEPCTYCVGDRHTGPLLRACGAVLGDLASLGFDAEWARVAASEVGAPHPRKRVFVYAWPAAADADRVESERRGIAGVVRGQEEAESGEEDQRERAGHAARHGGEAASHAAHLGHERPWTARRRGAGSTDGDLVAADASGTGLEVGGVEPAGHERQAAQRGRGERPAANADRIIRGNDSELSVGRNAVQRGVRDDAPRCGTTSADPARLGRGQGWPEPAGQLWRPDAAQCRLATTPDADSLRWRADVLELRPGQPDLDWGVYEPAIRRWERILGRPAPWPTDLRGRLTPVFSEWMMGLPDGWVTCTPGPEGMSLAALRNAMLRALGNGVVRLQAATAIPLLHQRAAAAQRAAA